MNNSCLGENRRDRNINPTPEGVWKNNLGQWCRTCPSCNTEIVSMCKNQGKGKSKVVRNHNNKASCKKCGPKNRKLPDKVNLTGSSSYKTFAYWNKAEENLIKIHASDLDIDELHLLVPRHSKKSLRTKANRLGIKISKELKIRITQEARAKVTLSDLCFTDLSLTLDSISNEEYQMLVGSILGDGCCRIHRGCRTQLRNTYAQYYEGHGEAQTEYLKWKMSFFEKFKPRLFIKKDNKPEIITCTHPIFSKIRNLVYKEVPRVIKGEEVIRMEKTFPHIDLVSRLDEFGLLIWYLDDGYAGSQSRFCKKRGKVYSVKTINPSIAAKSMDKESLLQAIEVINKNLGLSLSLYESKWKNSLNRIIRFKAVNRDIILPKWKEIALKYNLPKSMWYKLGIKDGATVHDSACESCNSNKIVSSDGH